jgi:two-component system, OmpR family, phosphate regulon sensor histidine kinase PhoR
MSERGLGERLLYFALVPAVVLAVAVLGWLALRTTLRIEQERQRTVFEATEALVDERLNGLDTSIVRQDNVVAAYTNLGETTQLGRRWLATAARETPTVRAILVVNATTAEHSVLAYASRNPSLEDDAFRRLLLTRLWTSLDLTGDTSELRHLHEVIEDRQYLVSYWQRYVDQRRVLVVVWHDVDRIVSELMPQLYKDPDRGNARMNIVDENGRIIFGPPIKVGKLGVIKPFPMTLTNWRLQVALASAEEIEKQVERRRLIEMSMVIVAGLVTIAGLLIVINASWKERRISGLKSEFVANVSHELKTPLSLIRMFGELLLLERATTEEKKKQYLSIIVGESERLTALIENVLDFARVERGKAEYDFAPANIGEVARRATEIFKFRAERDNVELSLEVEADLPEARVDQRAIELCIMNLIDNSIKYAKDGGRVKVVVKRREGHVVVLVVDFGPGIPKAEQSRIFERFYRGSVAGGTRARGSGIGLALVEHIMESHGGRATVESPTQPDGGGATFSLELPIVGKLARARSTTPS